MKNAADGIVPLLTAEKRSADRFRVRTIALDCARPIVIGALLWSIAQSISVQVEQVRVDNVSTNERLSR